MPEQCTLSLSESGAGLSKEFEGMQTILEVTLHKLMASSGWHPGVNHQMNHEQEDYMNQKLTQFLCMLHTSLHSFSCLSIVTVSLRWRIFVNVNVNVSTVLHTHKKRKLNNKNGNKAQLHFPTTVMNTCLREIHHTIQNVSGSWASWWVMK